MINVSVKTNYPKFTNPSATLTATGSKLLECGATQNTTFTVNFNRGTISPAYGTSGYRSGAATGYALNGGTVQTGRKTMSGAVVYHPGFAGKDFFHQSPVLLQYSSSQ